MKKYGRGRHVLIYNTNPAHAWTEWGKPGTFFRGRHSNQTPSEYSKKRHSSKRLAHLSFKLLLFFIIIIIIIIIRLLKQIFNNFKMCGD